jgi:hypothetical protein
MTSTMLERVRPVCDLRRSWEDVMGVDDEQKSLQIPGIGPTRLTPPP